MNIKIQSVHFDASEKLEQFIRQKVGKIDKYYDGILSAEVILKLDKSETLENKIAEITLEIRGNNLFAKKQNKTFEEAVDLACEALRKQLVKRKEKVKSK
ncbi:MAG: ribosome-associated translation inhibitor RaiA [Marinilabiliaceae bacterium]|nr:ribosome-associated translation inhibitor RaiA [Marinilabiliaceae bacterium]